jgi:hypothetical protein
MLGPMLRGISTTLPPPTFSYIGRSTNTANQTNYSFSSVGIGTAASDRLVVCVVSGVGSTSGERLVSSATIGEVSATIHVQSDTSTINTAIISAVVPTGTSATVDIRYNTSMSNCVFDTFSLYGLASTTPGAAPRFRGDGSSNIFTVSLNTETDGIVIAGSRTGSSITSHDWSGSVGVVENTETTVESRVFSSADIQVVTGGTAQTVTLTTSGNDDSWVMAATWR